MGGLGSWVCYLCPGSEKIKIKKGAGSGFMGPRGSLTYIHGGAAPAGNSAFGPRRFALGGHADYLHRRGQQGWSAQLHQHEVVNVCELTKPRVDEGLGGPDSLRIPME